MRSKFNPGNFNRLEKNPDHYKWGIFYFNPDDTRIILPKQNQWMGWTMNFANPWSYVILGSFIIIALIVAYYSK
jgi:uncharacterized membrane protein